MVRIAAQFIFIYLFIYIFTYLYIYIFYKTYLGTKSKTISAQDKWAGMTPQIHWESVVCHHSVRRNIRTMHDLVDAPQL